MKKQEEKIAAAAEHFRQLMQTQLERVEKIKKEDSWIDYSRISPLRIGIIAGDGIGLTISIEARRVLAALLATELEEGKVEFRMIEGLTIENRARTGQAIPPDILTEIKECPVLLKGPTTTPPERRPVAQY